MVFKLYNREYRIYGGMGEDLFIRKCEKRGQRFFTEQWWSIRPDGNIKKRRNKKYVSGAKFVRDMEESEVEAMFFLAGI